MRRACGGGAPAAAALTRKVAAVVVHIRQALDVLSALTEIQISSPSKRAASTPLAAAHDALSALSGSYLFLERAYLRAALASAQAATSESIFVEDSIFIISRVSSRGLTLSPHLFLAVAQDLAAAVDDHILAALRKAPTDLVARANASCAAAEGVGGWVKNLKSQVAAKWGAASGAAQALDDLSACEGAFASLREEALLASAGAEITESVSAVKEVFSQMKFDPDPSHDSAAGDELFLALTRTKSRFLVDAMRSRGFNGRVVDAAARAFAARVAAAMEEVIFLKTFNEIGALRLKAQISFVMRAISDHSSATVRDLLLRVQAMAHVLSVERPRDLRCERLKPRDVTGRIARSFVR